MHFRLLVTIDKSEASNSEEAQNYVENELLNDESFAGEGGRFSIPIADWFVIGGRWSGEISEKTWAKEAIAKIAELKKKSGINIAGTYYCDKEKTAKQSELRKKAEAIYQKAVPANLKNRGLRYDRFEYYGRGNYRQTGFWDDAAVVTKEIYEALLKSYEGESYVDNDGLEFVDLNDELVSKDFVGKKWLVVVDYHN